MYNRFIFYASINMLPSPAVFLGCCTVFSPVMNKCIGRVCTITDFRYFWFERKPRKHHPGGDSILIISEFSVFERKNNGVNAGVCSYYPH